MDGHKYSTSCLYGTYCRFFFIHNVTYSSTRYTSMGGLCEWAWAGGYHVRLNLISRTSEDLRTTAYNMAHKTIYAQNQGV